MTARSCLVVGSTRGIGLALVHELLERGGFDHVIATYRSDEIPESLKELARLHPDALLLAQLDFSDAGSLEGFSQWLAGQEGSIELTVHVAGILHGENFQPEKSLDQCDPETLLHYFRINSIGPLMVARAVLENQSRKSEFTFAAVSAMVGSIGDNRKGGWYGYRASKAALNQFIRNLANECRLRFPGAAMVAIHPGTTDTDLSLPFQKNIPPGKLYSPQITAKRLLDVLDSVNAEKSGRFLNWNGAEIPW